MVGKCFRHLSKVRNWERLVLMSQYLRLDTSEVDSLLIRESVSWWGLSRVMTTESEVRVEEVSDC